MNASIAARTAPQIATSPASTRALSIILGLATIAASTGVAAQSADMLGLPQPFGTSALSAVLGLAGLYAGSLWRGARRTALWLEQLPRPLDAPRRRALDAFHVRRTRPLRVGLLGMLRAEFHAICAANPTRRIEDKTAFLRRLATRCLTAAIVLVAISTTLLLA